MVIFTIGHSNRTLEESLEALKAHDIMQLVDVRAFPSSRKFPHFNQDRLRFQLERHGVRYVHIRELGGYRKSLREESPNSGWRVRGFRNYADFMLTSAFTSIIDGLLKLAGQATTAIMCAEANPYRCHRQLISDYLVAVKQVRVIHIGAQMKDSEHRITSFAKVEDGQILYPSPGSGPAN